MSYPKTKKDLTHAIQTALPETSKWKSLSAEQLLFYWWQTGRAGRGLRLTPDGQKAFAEAGISKYLIEIDPTIIRDVLKWNTLIENLTKKLECPYYIAIQSNSRGVASKYPSLWIYDHTIAVLIALYGDISTYLESVKIS